MLFRPVILKGKETKEGKTNIKIHFSFKGSRKELPTEFYIVPKEFFKGKVRKSNPNSEYINFEVQKKILEYDKKLLGVNYQNWTAKQLATFLKEDQGTIDEFYPCIERFISEKDRINKRTAEIYQATLNKIKTFEKRPNLLFSEMTVMWFRRFELFMQENDLKTNAISIHLRNIRTIFNAAIDDELIPATVYPFRRFKIKSADTHKKAISIDQIKKIRDYETNLPSIAMIRDAWMLSFYLIGINNSDLFKLKKIDKDGRISYERSKTHRQYSIKVEPEALRIIKKYKGKKSLLNYSEHFALTTTLTSVFNNKLKDIGKSVGIPDLTMYHARHTWATLAANQLDASNEDIGQALGHSLKSVTTGYIKRDPDRVDNLNRGVLDLLK